MSPTVHCAASSLCLHFHPADFLPPITTAVKKKKHLHWNYSTSWGLNKISSPPNNSRKEPLLPALSFFYHLNMCKNSEEACEQNGERPVSTLADSRSSSSSSRPTTPTGSRFQMTGKKQHSFHQFVWLLILFCNSASRGPKWRFPLCSFHTESAPFFPFHVGLRVWEPPAHCTPGESSGQ